MNFKKLACDALDRNYEYKKSLSFIEENKIRIESRIGGYLHSHNINQGNEEKDRNSWGIGNIFIKINFSVENIEGKFHPIIEFFLGSIRDRSSLSLGKFAIDYQIGESIILPGESFVDCHRDLYKFWLIRNNKKQVLFNNFKDLMEDGVGEVIGFDEINKYL